MKRRTEDDYERVREALDEAMLRNPNVAHIVRENPLSKKYREGLLRPVAPTRARKKETAHEG